MKLEPGEMLVWTEPQRRGRAQIRVAPSKTERRRHRRKYAEGELPPDRSFYFRGPEAKLNLRAQNLMLFLQIADGVDDDTWLHHLRQGDYSRWMRGSIKDDTLAEEVAEVEQAADIAPAASRARVRSAVEEHYTVPAAGGGAS